MAEKTGKPELSDGWLGIANELQEAISRARFTAYEHSLIDLIIRLSYGCVDEKTGEKKLTADLLHWSDLKAVGIPKQHGRRTAEKLRDKKVVKITFPGNRIRLRLNKYYREWKIPMSAELILYEKLIRLNLNHINASQRNGNTSVTEENQRSATDSSGLQNNGNTSVTLEDEGNTSVTEKVTRLLPESNTSVTTTEDKATLSADSQPSKEKKERRKENTNTKSNLVTTGEGVEKSSEVGGDGFILTEEKSEEDFEKVRRELGYHQVKEPARSELARKYQTRYLLRQMAQIKKDFTKGIKFMNPGGALVSRIRSGHTTEDYPE